MNPLHSCRKVAELLSQALDEPLHAIDSIRLRIHLRICGNCSNVEKQLDMLHKFAPEIGAIDLNDEPEARAPAEARRH